jgi:hypothetical protein
MDEPLPHAIAIDESANADAAEIEKRLARLEREIDVLKDTQALEDRVVERITDRLQRVGFGESNAYPSKDRLSRESYARLLFNILIDARLMVLTFFNKRFPLAWTTHVAVWILIPAILTSGWWFPAAYFPYLGTFFDKAFDLLLGFCVYRALSREVRRYRESLGLRR